MRTPFVAGNWKMNLLCSQAVALAKALADRPGEKVEIGICPPFVYLIPVADGIGNSAVKLGAQDVYFQPKGAFTGEISCRMLRDVGCEYVIIGHSERRHVLGEDDDLINAKLKAAVGAKLRPIFCVGETLDQREANDTNAVIDRHLASGLVGMSRDDLSGLVIAYEPVWAIGTGRNATPDQAQQVHEFIRKWLTDRFGSSFAQTIRIQYGGSVKASNAADLMAMTDVDGALVGGASLDADEFVKIIKATTEAKGL